MGFMASHLCDHLIRKGYEITDVVLPTPIKNIGFLKSSMKIVVGDVLDYFSLQKLTKDMDYVFHGAAISGINDTRQLIERSWDVNTKGTINVLKAAVENYVKRVLYISTCHILGRQLIYPVTEEAVIHPVDIYAASKASAEYICKSLMNMLPELDLVISRGFNHYGPRQREDYLIPRMITQALNSNIVNLRAS